MLKTLLILNDAPYGTERSYNGLRLAMSLSKRDGEEVNVFLMGDAVDCARRGQKTTDGYYNTERMIRAVLQRGGKVGACSSCSDARALTGETRVDGAHRSSMTTRVINAEPALDTLEIDGLEGDDVINVGPGVDALIQLVLKP